MSASAERRGAVRALLEVERGSFAGRLLAASAQPGVRARVLGVLRWQRFLDAVLGPLCRRPLERLDGEVRAVLRLGLLEVCRLGVPPPVATDAGVRLVRSLGKASAAGMVNAVLRRAAGAWRRVEAEATPDVRWSHPEWLYRRWSEAFGATAAAEVMAVDQEPAAAWVWLADESVRGSLEGEGAALEVHPWCPGAVTARDRPAALLARVGGGGVVVQDPSSQLVALVAAALAEAGDLVADLCAAPGGKTALLLARAPGVRVVAADLRPSRAAVVRSAVGAGAGVVAADALRSPWPPSTFDLVVLDAPCSGTGTLRRHPELRWRLDPAAIAGRAELQRRLAAAALDLVRPGGTLLYSTCSLEAEENEEVVTGLAVEPVPLTSLLPTGVPAANTAAGGIRVLPHRDGDGFTIHAGRRRG